jgi:hypothetical protein
MMVNDMATTALVLALPTSTAPPLTWNPYQAEMELMIKAKKTVFVRA